MLIESVLLLISILILWFISDNYLSRRNYPPGPPRLPLVGNVYALLKDRKIKPPFVRFQELNKKYGALLYLRMGFRNVVITDDFEITKEILHSEIWIDRPWNARIGERSFGKQLGIIFVSGDGWKEMRRFSIRTLRDFGLGKQTGMQAVMEEEVAKLLIKVDNCLTNNTKEPILEMRHLFTMPVLNIVWSMVSNIRTPEDDSKLGELIHLVDNLAKANPIGGNLLAIFPFIRFLFPVWSGHLEAKNCHQKLNQYFRDILEKRRSEGNYKDDKRDFIDMFVQEIDKHRKLGSKPNHYTDEQFITTITDLFEAGSETSSNTMEFAIYFAMKNPRVQEKVFKEIEEVVGHDRLPEAGDKNAMPYTDATLLEVQRMSNVLPIIIRCPSEDCTLRGFDIPKGTTAIMNIYGVHMDPGFWGDPFHFRPERFLDKDLKIIPEKAARIIPFGAGKRVCLGEQMARISIFTYFTSLLQKYKFLDVDNDNRESTGHPDLQKIIDVGFTLSPKSFVAKIEKRK